MDLLAGEADVGGGWGNIVPVWNEVCTRPLLTNLTPLLGGVVLVSKTTLRHALDFQRMKPDSTAPHAVEIGGSALARAVALTVWSRDQ